ncbi:MAG: hypothetical protein A2297_04835 [Elusimicrobia bacterium RIFOXYB2_FULL_48_7]|nr:MAG: hypothetical protein A2297_04835 [Elusimicrobia bacterium RIFOXYB2_FULL_48_7]
MSALTVGTINLDHSNKQSLYLQVSKIIEKKIRNKEILPGEKLPAYKVLCETFKVSKDTMQDALTSLANEGYIASRPRYGTVVLTSTPSLITDLKKKNELCIVACPSSAAGTGNTSTNYFAYNVIRGVERAVREKDMYLLYSTFEDSEFSFKGKEGDIAGLILTGNVTLGCLKAIKKMKIPFVLIGDLFQQTKTQENADIISNDDFNGTYLAAKHLIELGHTKIAYVDTKTDKYSWDIDYFNGYQHAYKEANLALDKELVIETGKTSEEDAYSAVKKFLDKRLPFTGLICLKGKLLPGIMKALDEKGLKIPQDISLINNSPEPPLTSITADLEDMGRTAVERILERITKPETWHPERIIVPYKLVPGNSTRKINDVQEERHV